ncbi:MAG TPA: hypothetical protein VEK57_20160 [Thermoanaerobaculia bacterium]|nr:hypothetical protein [Thermoanaerobaculia bacterium]
MTSEIRLVNVPVWTALTTAGLAIGLVAGLLVGMSLDQIVNAMVVTAAVTCCVGAVLGGFQAIGLRRVLHVPLWWVAATIVGVGAGLAAGVVLVEQVGIALTGVRPNVARLGAGMRMLNMVVVGLTTGTFLGAAQSLVLRRQVPGVKHWPAITAIGLAVAFAASSLAVDLLRMRFASLAGVVTFVLLAGIAFGLLTSWRLRRAA